MSQEKLLKSVLRSVFEFCRTMVIKLMLRNSLLILLEFSEIKNRDRNTNNSSPDRTLVFPKGGLLQGLSLSSRKTSMVPDFHSPVLPSLEYTCLLRGPWSEEQGKSPPWVGNAGLLGKQLPAVLPHTHTSELITGRMLLGDSTPAPSFCEILVIYFTSKSSCAGQEPK